MTLPCYCFPIFVYCPQPLAVCPGSLEWNNYPNNTTQPNPLQIAQVGRQPSLGWIVIGGWDMATQLWHWVEPAQATPYPSGWVNNLDRQFGWAGGMGGHSGLGWVGGRFSLVERWDPCQVVGGIPRQTPSGLGWQVGRFERTYCGFPLPNCLVCFIIVLPINWTGRYSMCFVF